MLTCSTREGGIDNCLMNSSELANKAQTFPLPKKSLSDVNGIQQLGSSLTILFHWLQTQFSCSKSKSNALPLHRMVTKLGIFSLCLLPSSLLPLLSALLPQGSGYQAFLAVSLPPSLSPKAVSIPLGTDSLICS